MIDTLHMRALGTIIELTIWARTSGVPGAVIHAGMLSRNLGRLVADPNNRGLKRQVELNVKMLRRLTAREAADGPAAAP